MTTWTNSKGNKIEAQVNQSRTGWVMMVDGVTVKDSIATIKHPVVAAMFGKYGIPHAQYAEMVADLQGPRTDADIKHDAEIKAVCDHQDRMARIMARD